MKKPSIFANVIKLSLWVYPKKYPPHSKRGGYFFRCWYWYYRSSCVPQCAVLL